MIQSPKDLFEEKIKKDKLIAILSKIANSADCGFYYKNQYSVKQLEEKLRDIAKLALNE